MCKPILILALVLSTTTAIAQVNDDIEIRKSFVGMAFYQKGIQLKSRQLKKHT